MTRSKEQVYSALWSRLTASVTGVLTASRKVRHYDEVPSVEQPAMFMEQIMCSSPAVPGIPSKQTIQAKVLLYAHDESEIGPMPQINGLVDQVEAAMVRQPGETAGPYATTLSGSVASAKIVQTDFGGGNLSVQGVAIITIEMVTA